ncbi:hypothetical protein EX30DRAFT_326003 [Ascodesmis nigricans]|uniref:RecQ-mediated genome instability protein 1 n=1 Tax=Ascodesmis nigricans TaxID=341454 RepID=A0A4S2N713_9PEZI|nr:hypothetical protein EX30DRAFT_326003 [Ascodesmis nigricans]
MPPTAPPLDHLIQALSSPPHHLPVKPTYLSSLLNALSSSPRGLPPPPALIATLKFRLLAADISVSLSSLPQHCLPPQLTTTPTGWCGEVRGAVLQVMDMVDITMSNIEALDALDMATRGERAQGRRGEIIRVVNDEDGGDGLGEDRERTKKNACHKLLLEDAAGRRVWALEVERIEGVYVGMGIGGKVWVGKAEIARGVMLLKRDGVKVLGGKVEALDKSWKDGRREVLMRRIEEHRGGR